MKLLTLFLVVFFSLTPSVHAQETASSDAQVRQEVEKEPSTDYVLPYPGLLPDNRLYFLKVARDHVIGFLIHEPLKKAEFNLLQSDKRLQAGVSLYEKDKNKHELVFSTISKGENYFEEAIVAAERAKAQKILISDFGYKLHGAQSTHKERVLQISKTVPVEERKKFIGLASRIDGFEKRIKQLLGETD